MPKPVLVSLIILLLLLVTGLSEAVRDRHLGVRAAATSAAQAIGGEPAATASSF